MDGRLLDHLTQAPRKRTSGATVTTSPLVVEWDKQLESGMRHFTATTEGQNRLQLRELLQRYADEQWVADHFTPEQAADAVLDTFKRAVRGELELLELECRETA